MEHKQVTGMISSSVRGGTAAGLALFILRVQL